MKIGIIGTGYVGLVHGAVMADFGFEVTCVDIDKEKIDKLNNGEVPIYEPGLKELLQKVNDRIRFTTDLKLAVENCQVIFIAVGTPQAEDGSADMIYVFNAAESIGHYMNEYKVIVDKSTVPVGTGKKVKETIRKQLENRKVNYEFDVVSNPEFLREGKAIKDSQLPDRIIIGCESEKAKEIMKKIYDVLYLKDTPFIFTNIETAETIKYAANAFLAVKISYINEMALLCEKVGADVQEVAKAMGMDGRISPKFLNPGPGFGGSCFPKDTRAIYDTALKNDEEMLVIKGAIEANEKQKKKMVEKIVSIMETVSNKTIGILGLSFKPETNDMREAPSITIIHELVQKGARIKAFCPGAMKEAKPIFSDVNEHIKYCKDEYETVKDAHAVVIITEWNRFRGMDLQRTRKLMKDNYMFDLRNIHAKDKTVQELFKYYGVGKG